MPKIIVAIDGYSSCGKSTTAKLVAKQLNYPYIDTGAMYRAVTLYFIQNHISLTNPKEVENALSKVHISFRRHPELGRNDTYLNGLNVEDEIRKMYVSERVSEVSAIAEVRHALVAQQQRMGKTKGIVMDGRDIGTVVCPDAELKIFMTADNAIRVERRFKELFEKNPNITIEEVKANIELRDYIDSHREVSPLKQAKDAVLLDNTNLTEGEQLKSALKWAREKIK